MKTNSSFRLCALAFAALAAAVRPALAEKVGYGHYKTIVDRQMFGPLPADFDPTKMPSEVAKSSSSASAAAEAQLTKEQEKLKSAVRFSVINVTPQGDVAVGFTDSSNAKAPKHYYLKKGEARDGWLVKEADPEKATVTLEKDGIELPLAIGEDSAKKDPKKGVAKDQARGANPGRSPLLGGSLGARSRLRKEERAKLAADNALLKQQMEEMKERQEQERLEREQEEARRKAEEEATREERRKELESLRQEISKKREKLTAPAPEEKAEEESNDENNDAE